MNEQKGQFAEKQEKNDIALRSRKHIDVTGVKDVQSFDEGSVVMTTCCGDMAIEGAGLKIGTLDTDRGIVSVDGKISAVIYYDDVPETGRRGLFGRKSSR